MDKPLIATKDAVGFAHIQKKKNKEGKSTEEEIKKVAIDRAGQ